MTAAGIDQWGALAAGVHRGAANASDPTWKDNAFVAFWDLDTQTFGSVHVSTSPNSPDSRRARCSVTTVDGQSAEVIETLPEGGFAGEYIDFGLDGEVRVEHPNLSLQLINTPLFHPADYSSTDLLPELVAGQPLQHHESACKVAGSVLFRGNHCEFAGRGFRDRSWGFRDESASFLEYALVTAVFDDAYLTAMKFLRADGGLVSDGFWITDHTVTPVVNLALRRSAAAQFLAAKVGLATGEVREISMTRRAAGYFVPMGVETEGPTFGAYDDFVHMRGDGRDGGGMVEQGILHRVH